MYSEVYDLKNNDYINRFNQWQCPNIDLKWIHSEKIRIIEY